MFYYNPARLAYSSCGATLVDGNDIPQALKRKVVITARHCVNNAATTDGVSVTFDETPGMVFGNGDRFATSFEGLDEPVYHGSVSYVALGNGDQWFKNDHAIIILDNAVPENIVPLPAQLPQLGQAKGTVKSNLTMTGYGTIIWGNSNSTGLGDVPNGNGNIVGIRDKMTIQMEVISVTNELILQSMVYALGDATACNGDSGSGIVIDGNAGENKPSVILSTVAGGDFACKSLNTSSRVDTQDFKNLLLNTISNYQ